MTFLKTSLAIGSVLILSVGGSYAQDAMAGHNMAASGSAAMELPAVCTPAQKMAGDMSMNMDHKMDQAHMDLMAGMDETNKAMMNSMMVEDIDVAFVCSMIPHHQGAINMAKAELAHGDNQWAKDMAQMVIDAQEKEIADMIAWLEGEGVKE